MKRNPYGAPEMSGGRAMIQYDDSDSDADDVSFADDDEFDRRGGVGAGIGGAGLSRSSIGGGFGGGSSFTGGGYGGSGLDGFGGGGDEYNFDFSGKASMWGSANDFDLDGGGPRKKGASNFASSTATAAGAKAAKAAAKPQASSNLGMSGGKAAATKLDIDKKFSNIASRFGSSKAKAAPAPAAPKKDNAVNDFQKFLDASDSDEDSPKPAPSNVQGGARSQPAVTSSNLGTGRTAGDKDDSDSDVSLPPSPVNTAPAPAKTTAAASAPSALATQPRREEASVSEVPSDFESSPRATPRASPAVAVSTAAARRNSSPSGSRSPSGSPAATPRAGFAGAGRSPSASSRSRESSTHSSRGSMPRTSTMANVPQTSGQASAARTNVAPKNEVSSVGQSTVTASAAPKTVAELMAEVNASIDAETDSSSEVREREQQATATYTDDFAGESTAQALASADGPQGGTYQDDFEPDGSDLENESVRAALQSSALQAAAKSTVSTTVNTTTVGTAATTRPLTGSTGGSGGVSTLQVPEAKPRQTRRVYSDASDDDDYRPRRPTCNIGIQANVPVDVGVQCDPPPPDPRAPDDPFGPWAQFHPSLQGPAGGAAGFPAMSMYGMPPAAQYFGGGMPAAAQPPSSPAQAFAGMPPGPYAAWGGYPMSPAVYQQPFALGPQAAAHHPLLRQLFGSAIAGPFVPPPRNDGAVGAREAHSVHAPGEAAEPSPQALGEASAQGAAAPRLFGQNGAAIPGGVSPAQSAFSVPYGGFNSMGPMAAAVGQIPAQAAFGTPYMQAMPVGAGAGIGAFLGAGAGSAPGAGGFPGGASPAALAALGMVDDSFREQIELLRKAAAIHRSRLEKARVPPPVNVAGAAAVPSPSPVATGVAPMPVAGLAVAGASPEARADS